MHHYSIALRTVSLSTLDIRYDCTSKTRN